MKKILLSYLLFILSISLFAQNKTYYDEMFYATTIKKKTSPKYYVISEEVQALKTEKFYTFNENLLVKTKTTSFNKEGKNYSQTSNYYNKEGILTHLIQTNSGDSSIIIKHFDQEGELTRKRKLVGNDTVLDIYYDDSGNEIEKHSELHPEPHQGFKAWNNYIAKNITYPKEARTTLEKGRVLVYFTISELGEIGNIEILNPESIHQSLAQVAFNLVKNYPHNWNPYILNGQIMQKEVIFPLKFKGLIFQ